MKPLKAGIYILMTVSSHCNLKHARQDKNIMSIYLKIDVLLKLKTVIKV